MEDNIPSHQNHSRHKASVLDAVGWPTCYWHYLEFCYETFKGAGLKHLVLFHCLPLPLFTFWLAPFQSNELLWAWIWLTYLPPPTLLFYLRNFFHTLYSKEATCKDHMLIHHHTPSIFTDMTDWQGKTYISEYYLNASASDGIWGIGYSRRTSGMETKKMPFSLSS